MLIFFALDLGLIMLSDENLLSGFSVLVNVHLNDKYSLDSSSKAVVAKLPLI